MASSSSASDKKRKGQDETVFDFSKAAGESKKQKKNTEAAALASLADVDIQKLMECEGPIVSCVLLKADGTIEAVEIDMTPRLRKVQEMFSGEITLLGQWEDIQVVLIAGKNRTVSSGFPLNKHKLQPPCHDLTVFGDILLTRSDDAGEAAHFPLAEYMEFKDKVITDWKPLSENDESQDEDDSDGSDESDEEKMMELIAPQLIAQFKEANGRAPTDEELENLKQSFLDFDPEDDEDDEEDDDEEDEDEEDEDGIFEALLPRLTENFVKEYGREPSEDELADLKSRLLANITAIDESGEDESGENEEEEDESGEEEEDEVQEAN